MSIIQDFKLDEITDISRVQKIINQDLSLDMDSTSSGRDELLFAITQRVAHLLERDVGLLFSYLYRLDVSESEVQKIMDPRWAEPTDISIARLILERQLQRLHTKKTLIQRPIKGWEW